jgi:peptidoglycan LD-endopeptidase LytH
MNTPWKLYATLASVVVMLGLVLFSVYWLIGSSRLLPEGLPGDEAAAGSVPLDVAGNPAPRQPHPGGTTTGTPRPAPRSVGIPPAGALLIPVAGVRPEALVDTYTQARSAGRSHDAIDIAAPRGTPVVAAAAGTVLKLFLSEQGGITLYQLGTDGRTIYYYAHLDRYAPGIAEGMRVQQGDTLGFVGDTGNSGAGNYHLHFEISTTLDPAQYWGGAPVNPYPLLRGAPGG